MQRLLRWLADFSIGHPWLAWILLFAISGPALASLMGWIGPTEKPPRISWETEEDRQQFRAIYESFPFSGILPVLAASLSVSVLPWTTQFIS